MNQSMKTELMIIVEQVVRPVDASHRFKNRIREELLSHLVEVYESELASGRDEASALSQTQRRFGQPTLIREQLQSTVPPRDYLFKKFEASEDESMLRAGLKFALIETVVFFSLLATVLLLANTFGGLSLSEAIALASSMSFLPVWLLMPLWLFGTALLMKWMEKSLPKDVAAFQWPPRTPRQLFVALRQNNLVLAAFALAACSIFAMAIVPSIHWPTTAYDWNQSTLTMLTLSVLGLTSLGILCAWCLALTVIHRRDQQQQWSSLPIESID